ncbi:DUF167 domain-containing protein [Peredibacter sp. HCB2-198]|uniref:DUF167 domain-containing protein n=1 Tax=Peredibacter sp. HCB2-198 TaxID=3383025 RepID=UPI0038B44A12
MAIWLKVHPKGCTLSLYIQPGASRSEISGLHGDRLKVKIKAPPVDGEANAALIKFMAETLGIAKKNVHLIHGETSRQKTLLVEMSFEKVESLIKV